MVERSESSVKSRTSIESTSMLPAVTSYNLGTNALMVVLPAPDGPTIAVKLPAGTLKEIPLRISPLSIASSFAVDSRDAREISSGRGYEK